jgi:hypothetical protein
MKTDWRISRLQMLPAFIRIIRPSGINPISKCISAINDRRFKFHSRDENRLENFTASDATSIYPRHPSIWH